MKRMILCALVLVVPATSHGKTDDDYSEPENVALMASKYQNTGRIQEAVQLFHPDALEGLKRMALQIAETPRSQMDLDNLLREFGVDSIRQMRDIDPSRMATTMLLMIERQKPPQMIDIMSSAKYEVIGSVPEDDQIHVVIRTEARVQGRKVTTISAVTVQKSGDKWLFLGAGALPE